MTSLYRHFAADGTLLYVGIATNALARQGNHGRTARWAPLVARIEIEKHPSRERAQQAEAWAIAAEAPMFNQRLATGLPSNAEVGSALRFTLAEAYALAAKGERFNTIDPVEFAQMPRAERRQHRCALNKITRQASALRRSERPTIVVIDNSRSE